MSIGRKIFVHIFDNAKNESVRMIVNAMGNLRARIDVRFMK
jgi:hypothetical protein